jgi:hypothetical protein
MQSPYCLCVCVSTFGLLNQPLRNLVCISRHLNPSRWRTSYIASIGLCLCVYTPIAARQRLGKNVTVATNTHATTEELLDASFSMWPVWYQVPPRACSYLGIFSVCIDTFMSAYKVLVEKTDGR